MVKSHHPVRPEYLVHIGDMVVSFALLESAIKSLIMSFINEHQSAGRIITAELPFKGLRALLMSLYLDRHGKDLDYIKLKKLMSEAGKIEEKRNQIVHSTWGIECGISGITRIKTTAKEGKGLESKFENMSVEDLKTFADAIKQLTSDIHLIQQELIKSKKALTTPYDMVTEVIYIEPSNLRYS